MCQLKRRNRLKQAFLPWGLKIVLSKTWRFIWEKPNKLYVKTFILWLCTWNNKYGAEVTHLSRLIWTKGHIKNQIKQSRHLKLRTDFAQAHRPSFSIPHTLSPKSDCLQLIWNIIWLRCIISRPKFLLLFKNFCDFATFSFLRHKWCCCSAWFFSLSFNRNVTQRTQSHNKYNCTWNHFWLYLYVIMPLRLGQPNLAGTLDSSVVTLSWV